MSRNLAKKESLEATNQGFLLLKTTFDCVSKVLMFATFMYVMNKGQFSSMMTLTAFYTNLAVLIIFNTIVNNNNDYKSARTWIGKGIQILRFLGCTNVAYPLQKKTSHICDGVGANV